MKVQNVVLGDVADSVDYGLTASAATLPVGPKFLRITDIQDDAVDWEAVPYCVADSADLRRNRLADGDIVFARTGATTGKSFLVRSPPENAVFASYLIRVRPSDALDAGYLAHFFKSPAYWNQIVKAARGAAQPGVNASLLKQLVVPLPPRAEQNRIAAILDKADAVRRKREQALATVPELIVSIFLEMFGDPATNPKDLPTRPLGALASKFSDGPFGSNLKSEHYVSHGIRVVRLQNIGVGRFVDEDRAFISDEHFQTIKKHECLPGDILVGTLGDPNLRACRLPANIAPALNKADCVQIRADEKVASPEYICALLNLPSTEQMAQGLILGQTRSRISMGRLKTLEVPVPPIEDQRAFDRIVAELASTTLELESGVATAKLLCESLSQRAFRGTL